jgi:hypothetical protein
MPRLNLMEHSTSVLMLLLSLGVETADPVALTIDETARKVIVLANR